MLSYRPRAPRLDLSLPLRFTSADGVVEGNCLNVSESGLLGSFARPLDLWMDGSLLLQFGEERTVLRARVARAMGHEAGMAFVYQDDREREAIRAVLDFASAGTYLTGKPPF